MSNKHGRDEVTGLRRRLVLRDLADTQVRLVRAGHLLPGAGLGPWFAADARRRRALARAEQRLTALVRTAVVATARVRALRSAYAARRRR